MIRRISLPVLGLLFVLQAWGREEYTRTFDKTVPWHAGEHVSVDHRFGDVTVRTHAGNDIAIHADIKVSASNANQAKTFADRVEILVEPDGSEVSIRTRYPQMEGFLTVFNSCSYVVRYEITVPETAPLEVRNAFGSVFVTGLKADSQIETSHGGIEFHDGRGTQHLTTSFANVKLVNNTGDVEIETANGGVDAEDVAGDLTIHDRFGSVTIARATKGVTVTDANGAVNLTDSGGNGDVKNSFGAVAVHGFRGDLAVANANGRVEATNVQGAAQLNTTFGEVKFADIGRQLSIHASNSTVTGQRVGGAVTIDNSFGQVTVSDIHGTISVHSANGSVSLANIQGDTNVKTSFGGVVLDGFSGSLTVTDTNGSVDATSASKGACQPITIHTSFAGLRVRLQPDASYHVTAHTTFGHIHTDFPLTVSGSMTNDRVDGTIGSGRCDMNLTDTNGGIDIVRAGSQIAKDNQR